MLKRAKTRALGDGGLSTPWVAISGFLLPALIMYVAFTAAHWPLHAKAQDIAKYKGRYDRGYEPIRMARFEQAKKLGLINPGWDLSPMWGIGTQ